MSPTGTIGLVPSGGGGEDGPVRDLGLALDLPAPDCRPIACAGEDLASLDSPGAGVDGEQFVAEECDAVLGNAWRARLPPAAVYGRTSGLRASQRLRPSQPELVPATERSGRVHRRVLWGPTGGGGGDGVTADPFRPGGRPTPRRADAVPRDYALRGRDLSSANLSGRHRTGVEFYPRRTVPTATGCGDLAAVRQREACRAAGDRVSGDQRCGQSHHRAHGSLPGRPSFAGSVSRAVRHRPGHQRRLGKPNASGPPRTGEVAAEHRGLGGGIPLLPGTDRKSPRLHSS